MKNFFGTLSVGLLTLGFFLGGVMTPAMSLAAEEDGAVATADDAGAKKTTKKKKKVKKSSKAATKKAKDAAEAKVADEPDAAEASADDGSASESDAKPAKKSKKTRKAVKSKKTENSTETESADSEDKEDAEKDADADSEDKEDAEKDADADSEDKEDAGKDADADSEDEEDAEKDADAEIEKVDASVLAEAGAEAGELRKIEVAGIEFTFCWCPAGTFQMGAPEDELGYSKAELLHSVKLSKGFWMLQSEVTQGMYEALTGHNPSYFSTKGFGKDLGTVSGQESTEKFPVDRVTYSDACTFCEKLSSVCGITFSLPTEAQWEYACRAGTSYSFYTDKAPTAQQANYKIGKDAPESTDEVGRHGKNPWNLYDMMGNVDEWCSDYYAADYYDASAEMTDPTGPESVPDNERVLRGGSFANMDYFLRSATRNKLVDGGKGRFDGFRIITVPAVETEAADSADDDASAEDAENEDSADDEASADDAENEDSAADEESAESEEKEESEEE